MTGSLVVLLPVFFFAVIAITCFVGCGLDTTGTKDVVDFQQYQNTVTSTNGLVGYWPLNDTSGTKAADLGPNHFDGTYTVGPNVPAYDAATESDASPGTFTLNQQNLVPGDTVNNDQTTPSPSVKFDGGFVKIPRKTALSPPQFTLEAWVIPNWTVSDAQNDPSYRAVVSCAAAGSKGFALYASPDNHWTATVGNATAKTGSNQTIVQGSLYFLVVTFDGSTVTLWVNPADTTQPPDATAAGGAYVAVPSPVPFYIGTGRPDLPTPTFPFNGWIQDVAIYNAVLDNNTIEHHYANGEGLEDP